MADFFKPIPKYLTSKRNIVQLVLLTAAFALAFINIYQPFGVNVWFDLSPWQLLLYSSLITLTGVMVVVISRIIMYYRCKRNPINYWQYLGWVLVEVVSMAMFYSVYIKFILHDTRFFPNLLKLSIQNTALLLLLPYSVLWLYFSWRDKKIMIDEMSQGLQSPDSSKLMAIFEDEKGVMRFSVKMENLLYIEASDNYVSIFYMDKEKITRFMLRNTLKNLEESLKGTDIIRCHRRFMVNCDLVKVIRREKDGIKLELGIREAQDLPVTKTYLENVMSTFSHYSPSSEE
ncbi:MAG: LytTR family transcriptional regulator [Bacteroidetes bacterium]|nr:LytTR family transcriptional regulator [Bacteroidota bacterium]